MRVGNTCHTYAHMNEYIYNNAVVHLSIGYDWIGLIILYGLGHPLSSMAAFQGAR